MSLEQMFFFHFVILISYMLSHAVEARDDPSKTPLLTCPEIIFTKNHSVHFVSGFNPHNTHPMIQLLLQERKIKIEVQSTHSNHYSHTSTRLLIDTNRKLKALLCHYKSATDFSDALVRFSFSPGFAFLLDNNKSLRFLAHELACVSAINSFTAKEECAKKVTVHPGFILIQNRLNLPSMEKLLLELSHRKQYILAKGAIVAVPFGHHFTIYRVAPNSPANRKEICSSDLFPDNGLKKPALVEIKEARTNTGAIQPACYLHTESSGNDSGQRASSRHQNFAEKPSFYSAWEFMHESLSDSLDSLFINLGFIGFSNLWNRGSSQFFTEGNPYQQWFRFENSHPQTPKKDNLAAAYKTLGLPPGSSKNTVKKKYRELAKNHHPDKGGDVDAFQRYTEAYEVIKESWE